MNIQEAKIQIARSVQIYLMKNEYGEYRIPIEEQRPIFMIGAPGIGKTAIMEQIAQEMGIGLVSYSMTHHTRQSALGLPMIVKQTYAGTTFEVSRYTLSEILSSVYDHMEQTGQKEGILFLDEINCVSETLAPAMLQFLQYKTFGNHQLPQGWVVVTAGNPQEYNRSVHAFDVATLDRLKTLQVEPDYEIWRQYALAKQIHPSILSFLDIRNEDFYSMETTVEGRAYVTARGWEDLSVAIRLYEEEGFVVDESLIHQYLHSERIANAYASYYDLFMKYRSDYQVQEILDGCEDPKIQARIQNASMDEQISVATLLLEKLFPKMRVQMEQEQAMRNLIPSLRQLERGDCESTLQAIQNERSLAHENESRTQKHIRIREIQELQKLSSKQDYDSIKELFNADCIQLRAEGKKTAEEVNTMIQFVERYFPEESGLFLILTQLTVNHDSAMFLAKYGSEAYDRNSERLNLKERHQGILSELSRTQKDYQS